MFPHAFLFAILNLIKFTPFFIHLYFQNKHNIVLTQTIMKKMAADKKKNDLEEIDKETDEESNQKNESMLIE